MNNSDSRNKDDALNSSSCYTEGDEMENSIFEGVQQDGAKCLTYLWDLAIWSKGFVHNA